MTGSDPQQGDAVPASDRAAMPASDRIRLDHVGVVVDDLDEASRFLEQAFGLLPGREVRRADVRAVFFRCGQVEIEMIEVLDPQERERRLGGGGSARIEHVAVEVADLDEALDRQAGLGVRPIGSPRATPDYRTVFTEAESSDGVTWQLLERGSGDT
jgi:methylmalonyl-CoA/ethylmalonyl-CoA epimerase